MKQFFTFVRKEFYHVLRDPKTLLILFGMPVMQILIFGFALTNEVKNSRIVILDYAHDQYAQQLITRIEASRYFDIERSIRHDHQLEAAFREGDIRMAVIIPSGFEHDLSHQQSAAVQIILDASDPNIANTIQHYIQSIVLDFQMEINGVAGVPMQIRPEVRMLYNPQLKGAHNFVPGVMALVLMLVSVMMTALAIVREKETGTMEVLLVSPFRPALIILAKAVPYLGLSIINVITIVSLSVFVLELPVKGSLLLLMGVSVLFIIANLILGIFVSIRSQTQQGAMMISLIGMMMPTMMFSGFMFPVENMPLPLQWISNLIAAKWYYIIVKSVMIKGLGMAAIWKETLVLTGIAVFFFLVSLKSFKIRLA